WFDAYSADGPYRLLVADTGDAVIGYASSSRFKTRDAYRTSVETTIYVHPDATGTGIGNRLYGELLARLRADDRLHRAYAGIALPNDASIALHESLGFHLAGTYREVGYKFDRYWDVAWYECDLD
ncbi:MAG: GNAT family N-acetyltransferase, partial [Woeseiaceae bacterium]|nr:GNAT family N-acetyltransferase [Woeseiaceae bacterium]